MAKKPIDYLYSAYSAYAYIGHGAFLKIAKEANRPVIHRPFRFNEVFECYWVSPTRGTYRSQSGLPI